MAMFLEFPISLRQLAFKYKTETVSVIFLGVQNMLGHPVPTKKNHHSQFALLRLHGEMFHIQYHFLLKAIYEKKMVEDFGTQFFTIFYFGFCTSSILSVSRTSDDTPYAL